MSKKVELVIPKKRGKKRGKREKKRRKKKESKEYYRSELSRSMYYPILPNYISR